MPPAPPLAPTDRSHQSVATRSSDRGLPPVPPLKEVLLPRHPPPPVPPLKVVCLKWLDTKEEHWVVFVCFGSWCHFTVEQLQEMAVGLEVSGRAFLWAVKGTTEDAAKAEEWMPKRWEERGLVVRSWAPQVLILDHKAVGAFLTHCGWNSVLEAVAIGVPMLAWPLVFE